MEVVKRKRGRPKGSKNKVKPENELNPITMPVRDPSEPYVFVAASCGCRQTSMIYGAAMFCKHKNSMILQK